MLAEKVKSGAAHPMDVKMSLAQEIIAGFHGTAAGEKAAAEFQRIFRDREAPEEMKEIALKRLPTGVSVRSKIGSTESSHMSDKLSGGPEKWSKLLAYLGVAASASEAERVIKQGGFEINGSLVKDPACKGGSKPTEFVRSSCIGKKKFLRISCRLNEPSQVARHAVPLQTNRRSFIARGIHAGLKAMVASPTTTNAIALPSGPTVPPVGHARPWNDEFSKCPGATMPLFGTEKRKVSPQSNAACNPTANHKFPVRRSVRQKNMPITNTLSAPILSSPPLAR